MLRVQWLGEQQRGCLHERERGRLQGLFIEDERMIGGGVGVDVGDTSNCTLHRAATARMAESWKLH